MGLGKEKRMFTATINSISRDENKWSAGYFVKPAVRSKAFTGKTISSIKDLMGCKCHRAENRPFRSHG